MFIPPEPGRWQGRVDEEDGAAGRRWHQMVRYCADREVAFALLGFASDLGVQRNKGRAGASAGPEALRKALAGQAWHHDFAFLDDGDVKVDEDLAGSQAEYASRLAELLGGSGFVVGLGGGHEIGWASYLGCRQWLDARAPGKVLGILNFDAHFDLRRPAPDTSSGTPFYQVAADCESRQEPFHYACLGISRQANTRALFSRAEELGVKYLHDVACTGRAPKEFLRAFLRQVDFLYLTCCMDVFPAARAPGVSAPAALGVDPAWMIDTLGVVGEQCRELGVGWLMADVAELSPPLDRDHSTARLAARIVDEIVAARFD